MVKGDRANQVWRVVLPGVEGSGWVWSSNSGPDMEEVSVIAAPASGVLYWFCGLGVNGYRGTSLIKNSALS